MELEVRIDRDSFSIAVGNPFRLDLDALMKEIEGVAASSGATLDGLDVKGLLPRMVRGVAGCEAGCPSNAKELVSRGFKNFALAYVEGGILTATCRTTDGKFLSFKLFPDF